MILPAAGVARSKTLLRVAINFLSGHPDPMDAVVNHVLEVSADGAMHLSPLPIDEANG